VSEPASDAELRRAVAADHGLDERAARLLVGATVEELEASAAALARLIRERREEPEPAPASPADVFGAARRAKDARKRALLNALTSAAPQRRDERGRFAGTASFDGGARQSVESRPETHDQTLTRLLRSGEANVGGHF
jgi:hypothetical protein